MRASCRATWRQDAEAQLRRRNGLEILGGGKEGEGPVQRHAEAVEVSSTPPPAALVSRMVSCSTRAPDKGCSRDYPRPSGCRRRRGGNPPAGLDLALVPYPGSE